MKNEVVRSITVNAIVAVIYFLLTFFTPTISFLGMQVRIAECLILLCFFRRDYVIGITLGCIFANFASPISFWDILFGSLATLISGLLISYMKNLFFSTLIPVILNGFIVGAELYFILEEPFWINVAFVMAGEAIAVSIVGYIIFMIFGKKPFFQNLIGAKRNLNFKW
ncbi:MAG TPA: QueT transporter family protein [Firmicutes bacterium]|nr:QueT transporter family protein [Bacillota bacterium]